ncbi:MAG TPA: hypothetical protein VHE35_09015 [Kofleriaceae bacterium]|nr:hypothetical protein [Kofleriaceae bacterium]
MATCVHCGKAKGQRDCPALGGEICARCCGKYRLTEIACPADCRWLGGLAVLRADGPQPFTAADEDAAFRKLVRYTETARELADGRAAFCAMLGYDRRPPDEELAQLTEELDDHTAAAITSHLGFGHRAADGTRAIDRMLASHGRDLTRGEAAAMVAMQRARGVLATVQAAQVGVGMVLRDRLAGGYLTVGTSPDDMPAMGSHLFLWVLDNAGKLVPTGPMLMIPPASIDAVEARLRDLAAGASSDEERRLVLAAAAPHVLAVLRTAAAAEAAASEAASAPPPSP